MWVGYREFELECMIYLCFLFIEFFKINYLFILLLPDLSRRLATIKFKIIEVMFLNGLLEFYPKTIRAWCFCGITLYFFNFYFFGSIMWGQLNWSNLISDSQRNLVKYCVRNMNSFFYFIVISKCCCTNYKSCRSSGENCDLGPLWMLLAGFQGAE